MQNGRQNQIPGPNPALAQMLREDGTLDRLLEGKGLEFDTRPPPVVQPPRPLEIPPYDGSSFVDPPERKPEPQPEPEPEPQREPDPQSEAFELQPLRRPEIPKPPSSQGAPESLSRRARRARRKGQS
jgi:hypothetical protein